MTALLHLEDVHTYIGQYHILEGVSVEVPEGSIVALLGRNGAGKTTTLRSILGLAPPRSGTVLFDGIDIVGRRPFDIAALGIGYVPEHRAIFSDLSVQENLTIAEGTRTIDFLRGTERTGRSQRSVYASVKKEKFCSSPWKKRDRYPIFASVMEFVMPFLYRIAETVN